MSIIQFAVNYSSTAERLLKTREASFDRFKLPAWPDQIAQVSAHYPVYVHLPLIAGPLDGKILDTETNQEADWEQVDRLVDQTGTPTINLHLQLGAKDLPGIPPESLNPSHVQQVIERYLRCVQPVVDRYGSERVILENIPYMPGLGLLAGADAGVVRQVVEETEAGLLLDISHALLTALRTGQPVEEFLAELPVEHIREIHLSGVRILEGEALAGARAAGWPHADRLAGQYMDHQGLTETDYELVDWVLEKIAAGAWRAPWIISLECGGVGSFFQALTPDTDLARDIPRLAAAIQKTNARLAEAPVMAADS